MSDHIIRLARDVASSYLTHNSVRADDVPGLIKDIFVALTKAEAPAPKLPLSAEPEKPTVQAIRRSIHKEFLISFIDGKHYKSMRRHVGMHGYTPESYRERYGLPINYPMVCAAYSETRSSLAKSSGLGLLRRKSDSQSNLPEANAKSAPTIQDGVQEEQAAEPDIVAAEAPKLAKKARAKKVATMAEPKMAKPFPEAAQTKRARKTVAEAPAEAQEAEQAA